MNEKSTVTRWLGLLFAGIVIIGCQQKAPTSSDQSSKPETKEYEIRGKVVAVGDDQKSVTLDHEDIEGLMKAMEMKFTVKDSQVIANIQPGDQVHGHLTVESGDYIITQLEKR